MCIKCVKNPSLTRDSFCADSGAHLANFASCTGCNAASNALVIKVSSCDRMLPISTVESRIKG